ncbi:MAG: peroxiredoxin [Oricola sp.]
MTINIGETIPALTVKVVTDEGPAEMTTGDLFNGKKVALFGLPGAFTPTCSMNHLPGFIDNRDAFTAKGVDDVICVSVNDHHVMKAWADATGAAGKIRFVADWDAALTKALGLDADLSAGGLGVRSRRYSMLVEDGKVTMLNIEESRGQAIISGAAALLQELGV